MASAGKWRLLLLFFSPAVLIALLIGMINLGAFYQLQAAYHEDDKSRIQQLQEASTLTDFNQRLAQVQLQMEQLLARHATTALSRSELEQVGREIGVRLTALDWEFGNRFTSSGVTSEIYQALDAAEAHRQVMLQAVETATTDPQQAKVYIEAATAKQQLLSQASNTIVERVVNELLTTWQRHNREFETHTRNTILMGAFTVAVLLVLWLFLIGWLSRNLLQLTGALQQLAQPDPQSEPERLTAVEKIASSPANLMHGMANSVLAFRDTVKARQEAEHELRKLSLVVEQNPNAVLITDLGCRIEYVNDAFVEMTGYERDWVIGRNPRLLRSGKTPHSTYQSMWQQLLKGQNWQGEFINRRRDGRELIERAIIMPLHQPSGEITHYVAIKHDITKHKQMQEELDRYHSHLEQLVSERTRELQRAKVAAEVANRSKSEFLANISHELLTPMNTIIGLTHLVSRSTEVPQQLEKLEKVDSTARHLLSMINNLLDLSRVETGQLELERQDFDLEELVQRVMSRIQPQADDAGLGMMADIGQVPHNLHGNSIRLEQVLFNLVANAVKFTEQGEVRISVETVARDAEKLRVRFKVIDTGIGIDNVQKGRLFQAFEQVDSSTTRRYGGSGLGLAVSKRMVQLMEGDIGVESQPGEGSTFWFELPMSLAKPVAARPEDNH
ncbi:ATP-binding protein [Marinobacterium sp. MBR-109]|jgi:PAS domain S-box-containing protein|uniref:PAS domain-containing hybrid sensor histidine kinase/response regulator n=1 Tax=Marinobacterium sp. MBR-109 TaxID=3156462 RepID=UPI0033957910